MKKKGRGFAASLKKRKQSPISASELEDEFGISVKRVKYSSSVQSASFNCLKVYVLMRLCDVYYAGVHRKVPNVLMEYFGQHISVWTSRTSADEFTTNLVILICTENDLNLHSESEDDADDEDGGDDDEDGSEEKEEKPFITRTMDIYKTFAKKPPTSENSVVGMCSSVLYRFAS